MNLPLEVCNSSQFIIKVWNQFLQQYLVVDVKNTENEAKMRAEELFRTNRYSNIRVLKDTRIIQVVAGFDASPQENNL